MDPAQQSPPDRPAPRPAADGAITQSVSLASRFLAALVLLLCLAWLASGLHTVQPGKRAVVLRAGRVDREHGAGYVFALPRPFEEVELVPAAEQQITLAIGDLDLINRGAGAPETFDVRAEGGYALTGDVGVVHLQGTVVYHVADARAWWLAQDQIAPALHRTFCAAVVAACAERPLDGVMVARNGAAAATDADVTAAADAASKREQLRNDVAAGLTARLKDLDLGIEIQRVDLTAFLPDRAQVAFDAVTAAESDAATEIASANTAAEHARQQAAQDAEAMLRQAEAHANEALAKARVATNAITALEAETSPVRRKLLLERIYRERIEALLQRCTVVGIDPRLPAWLALPGGN
jgi:regulator of protease activity HflC (stomatin/prohibitin superfamily)